MSGKPPNAPEATAIRVQSDIKECPVCGHGWGGVAGFILIHHPQTNEPMQYACEWCLTRWNLDGTAPK